MIATSQYPVTALITMVDGTARIASDSSYWPAACVRVGETLTGEVHWYVVEANGVHHVNQDGERVSYGRAIPIYYDDAMMPCPYCLEPVLVEADECPHCRSRF
jgi:hypothetical protein